MKKISKIYLAIFGNSAILMEKEQNKWVVCENSFAKGTLRARGFKRNFGVALIVEVISNKDLGGPKVVLVPPFPFPRVLRGFFGRNHGVLGILQGLRDGNFKTWNLMFA